jgi:hypothetical protein
MLPAAPATCIVQVLESVISDGCKAGTAGIYMRPWQGVIGMSDDTCTTPVADTEQ